MVWILIDKSRFYGSYMWQRLLYIVNVDLLRIQHCKYIQDYVWLHYNMSFDRKRQCMDQRNVHFYKLYCLGIHYRKCIQVDS